jgi:UDP-N-acetylmuramoylalanine--D-glutamate ligase
MRPRPPIPAGPYLVVGLARSGLAAARLLAARGEQVIAVDVAAPPGARAALQAPGVEVHLGDDGLAHLGRCRAVVKSPGVPATAPAILAARAAGVPVLGELEFAWRLLPNEFIAVTATNGKTTTAELIGYIHREAGLPVAVAGNVGVALSGLVGEVPAATTIVCEASSFQLEDTLAFAPEAAVLLNIAADHLDRHGSFPAYREAKLQIFANQRAGDVAVLPVGFVDFAPAPGVRHVPFGPSPYAQSALREDGYIWWGEIRLLPASELLLRGAHNLDNALAAAAVCLARGVDVDAVCAALRSFPGVPHRLQEVADRDGVLYINDSKATNVTSTLVALDALPDRRVHLILGGQGKHQDFTPLADGVQAGCSAVYLIGEDAPAIAQALEGTGVPLRECGELERAVSAASAAARPGEVVLLSPACASFDQFADFEARGARFVALVSGDV